MTNAPPPKRRGWIDALVATALRWNDRLSRPVGAPAGPVARDAPSPRVASKPPSALPDAARK